MPIVGLQVHVVVDDLVDPDEAAVPTLMRLWDEDGRNIRRYQKLIWTMVYQIAYGSAGNFLSSQVEAHVLGLCFAVLDSYAYQTLEFYVCPYE